MKDHTTGENCEIRSDKEVVYCAACSVALPLAADISPTTCNKILTMTLDRSAIKGVIQRCDIMLSAEVPVSLWRPP